MTISVAAVEAEAVSRIVALTATAYDQGGISAAWTEATTMGPNIQAPAHMAHLRFQAAITDSPSANGERETPGGEARLRSRLDVSFSYILRQSQQRADARLARDAANDIVKAMNVYHDEWDMEIVNAGRPAISGDGRYLAIALSFDIFHNIEV